MKSKRVFINPEMEGDKQKGMKGFMETGHSQQTKLPMVGAIKWMKNVDMTDPKMENWNVEYIL